ncbi:hypothetical protein HBI56_017600 [Parastagonospora nodorum]|uniref:Uncharacterized protein n=1 Tax=Phaeosphaeria nodorum (strain SN15 / ATCC MYA-4574 / FGSC 10173) TaxID=321614 RepID=A0A7U2F0S1_PHANO|nr:hypothetical protein HBH56_082410 [Parastagonospora nodorum]QRC96654.1 hypothetical protein JI435_409370 [Parastagonospora nodorum SN15]KAH3929769.1 hypothetical protein HBH54_119430 [Parastagonospora nodorum]KAH3955600.1 hypothetical protein HBH53_005140 [Parastagonospora nodorum]KAH4058461.1 hypothetical protein HBH49_033460 [Parastagonospora nodorum]
MTGSWGEKLLAELCRHQPRRIYRNNTLRFRHYTFREPHPNTIVCEILQLNTPCCSFDSDRRKRCLSCAAR